MNLLKYSGREIKIDGISYYLLFNVNVIDQIQEEYDQSVEEVLDSIYTFENKKRDRNAYDKLSFVVFTLLNESVRMDKKKALPSGQREISLEEVRSELVTIRSSAIWTQEVYYSFAESLAPKLENEESESPNVESEIQN